MGIQKGSSTPPPAPDPFRTAAAQTGSNVETAIANAVIGNANEVTPWGTTTYRQIGTHQVGAPGGSGGTSGGTSGGGTFDPKLGFIPGTGGTGVGGIGGGYNVPQFERTVTLSPGQQRLFDQQQQLGGQLNQLAMDQTGRLQGMLSSPLSAAGLPNASQIDFGNAPNYHVDPVGLPNLQDSLGDTNFEGARRSVEDAIYSRLNPQLDRDRAALETRLINQGMVRGTEGFTRAMDEANRQANDARMQAVLAGGQEQSRLFDIAQQTARFGNEAQQQEYANAFGQRQYHNDLQARMFGDQMNIAGRMDTQRDRALQERAFLRNAPINEIGALMSGGQLNLPSFSQYNAPQVQGTPVGSYIYNTAALNNQNYQQQQAQRNAQLGGLFGLGSSAIMGASMFSDRRLKKDVRSTGLKLLNGLPLYLFRYIGDAVERVGLMADDVEKVIPAAVFSVAGFKAVDYGMATNA